MMVRSEDVTRFCTSKADFKDAIEDMAYNGYAIWMKDDYQCTGTAIRCKFVFEYENADGESVKLEFSNLWVRTYSSTIYIDGKAYDIDLLCQEFGGVWFSVLLN